MGGIDLHRYFLPVARFWLWAPPPMRAQLSHMDTSKKQPGGAPIGSRQGGAPDAPKETEPDESGRVHRTPTERASLIRNPNWNQADNDRGSQDQTDGLQTGNDIDE
jgi:hypothetical protein